MIICIGSTSKDIFFPTKEGRILETPEDLLSKRKIIFEPGAKYHINNRFESLGGCAANQACGLRRLGVSAECYTSIGDDAVGDWIKEQFSKEGVGANLVDIEKDCFSGLSAIIVDERSGERIIFSNQEANERLKINAEKLSVADFISVTDLSGDWKSVIEEVIKFCERENIKLSFNPRGINIKQDPQKVFEFAGRSEIFFANKDEAIEIISCNTQHATRNNLNDEGFLLKELKKSGARIVVITDGERGAWASDGNNPVHADAIKAKTVDSTGAGDAFASGFLAAVINEKSLEEALKWGIANSGNVVKFYGAIEGLLDIKQIIDKTDSIIVSKVSL